MAVFTCPHCHQRVQVAEVMLDQALTCPLCSGRFRAPIGPPPPLVAPAATPPPPAPEPLQAGAAPQQNGPQQDGPQQHKACPYCGEQILAVAVKCKHCGSLIGPAGGAALSGVEVAEPGEGEPFSFLNSLGSSAAGDSGSRATPRARRAGPSAAQSNRIVVGACAILLGSLGIHKFILGLTAPGVIMLVVTALTANWAHVWGALPMGIIGLIEGIIYLTKSDEEFHQRYVVEKQAWF